MNYRLTYKFYLNDGKPRADSKFPLYLRIIVNREKVEIALNAYLLLNGWDAARQRAKKDTTLNDRLSDYEQRIHAAARTIELEGHAVGAKALKDMLTGKAKADDYLLQYFGEHITYMKRNPELQPATISRYHDTLDHLTRFVKTERKASDYHLRRVDLKFVREFDMYLLNFIVQTTGKTLERNTVNKHLTRFKTVILKAISEGIITANPFSGIKLRYTPSKRDFLTDDELKALADLHLSHSPTLERVRDIFFWQCYTGLRFEDAMTMKVSAVKKDSKGNYQLTTTQEKTNQPLSIPLLPHAVNLFNKYDNTQRKITGNIFPRISNQKANLYLKHMATMAGIEKPLTTHVARHTCATTILLQNEVPIEAVSKWLGHTQIRTTQIYGKITSDYLRNVANKIVSKL